MRHEGPAQPVSPIVSRLAVSGWLVAGVLGATAIWLGVRQATLRAQNVLWQQKGQLADLELKSARMEIEAERILVSRFTQDQKANVPEGMMEASVGVQWFHPDSANTAELRAVAIRIGENREIVVGKGLPVFAPARRYALWLVASTPVNLGTISVADDGSFRFEFKLPADAGTSPKLVISRQETGPDHSSHTPDEVLLVSP